MRGHSGRRAVGYEVSPREGGEVDEDGGDDDGVDGHATDPLLSADLPGGTISSTLTFDDDEGGGFAADGASRRRDEGSTLDVG
jgi:hypothetical protein